VQQSEVLGFSVRHIDEQFVSAVEDEDDGPEQLARRVESPPPASRTAVAKACDIDRMLCSLDPVDGAPCFSAATWTSTMRRQPSLRRPPGSP